LHAVSKDNFEALDTVIKDLRKDGYVFKSLNEIK
ncbi:MAG TPA: polysaccharide deacetylase, partial [bacterium]|nr:polysaccharide deacetylase [bacterium]